MTRPAARHPARPRPDLPLRLGAWLPYRLFIVAAQIARPLAAFYGERFGLSQAGWRILAAIAEHDGASAADIGRACGLDAFAVSRGIAQLVELRFATRGSAGRDRRVASLRITARGRSAFAEIAALGHAIEADLLAPLTTSERHCLDGALDKLEQTSRRIETDGWQALAQRTGRR
ncbi:MarR family winged helix-turn-helix transcriptional regulator [Bradyrhizobium sp. 2TAF24]|uniref:MarR family winged helix-turn-helix transcriptional regulator n=1 Tax=Bradyrhizobium sp. 2TAF24 TaxID=3233011 RepID=UPI003F8E799F